MLYAVVSRLLRAVVAGIVPVDRIFVLPTEGMRHLLQKFTHVLGAEGAVLALHQHLAMLRGDHSADHDVVLGVVPLIRPLDRLFYGCIGMGLCVVLLEQAFIHL